VKILFILGAYLPNPSANGVCVKNAAGALKSRGHAVTVLCRRQYDDSKGDERIDGVRVVRAPGDRLHELSRRLRRSASGSLGALACRAAELARRALSLIEALIWPLDLSGRGRRLYRAALTLCKADNIDTVVCVCTPWQALCAGLRLKRTRPDIRFIPCYFDTLSGGIKPRLIGARLDQIRKLRYERAVDASADRILYMNAAKAHCRAQFLGDAFYKNIRFVDNPLLLRPDACGAPGGGDRITVLYAGTLTKNERDPGPFLALLARFEDKRIRLQVAGGGNCAGLLEAFARAHPDAVELLGALPHGEAGRLMQKADVLLNIGNQNANMLTSKIFEYMSCGKPILSLYSTDADAALPYLARYPLAQTLDAREADLARQAARAEAFIRNARGRRIDFDTVKALYPDSAPEAFVRALGDALA